MKIAFLLYPTHKIKTDEDTSFWIMHELASRGHHISHFESSDMVFVHGEVKSYLSTSQLDHSRGFVVSKRATIATPLNDMDAIFIRKEPPFNNEYLYALQLLKLLNKDVFVLNDPNAIAMCNEKLFILNFVDMAPDLVVTSSTKTALDFIRGMRTPVVIKPLNNKGGVGVIKTDIKDRKLGAHLAHSTDHDTTKIMIQRYIPQNDLGDKRILLLNGKTIGSFIRRPSKGDFRANLSVGGTMHPTKLNKRDEQIAQRVGRECAKRGLYFVGLDVIGPYLSEINVTSPSGIPEIKQLEGLSLEKKIADFIEDRSRFFGRKRLKA
jgi:glutathione synthase